MSFSTLDLGYKVRRAKLDHCESLIVFSHDLDTFCIPLQFADRLAETYKRYLIGAGILDWVDDSFCDEQDFEDYRCTIKFFCEKEKVVFVPGEFSLGAAIDFIWLEAKLSQDLVIRWCMMMEFLVWQDHRYEVKREREKNEVPSVSIDEDDQIKMEGGDL